MPATQFCIREYCTGGGNLNDVLGYAEFTEQTGETEHGECKGMVRICDKSKSTRTNRSKREHRSDRWSVVLGKMSEIRVVVDPLLECSLSSAMASHNDQGERIAPLVNRCIYKNRWRGYSDAFPVIRGLSP